MKIFGLSQITFWVILFTAFKAFALGPGTTPVLEIGWWESGGDYWVSLPPNGPDDTYKWNQALSSEDEVWRHDVYENTSTGATLTVTGQLSFPYLSTLVASGVNLVNGFYTFYEGSTTSPLTGTVTVNGVLYTGVSQTTVNEIDFTNFLIYNDVVDVMNYENVSENKHLTLTRIPSSTVFSTTPTFTISGDETGFYSGTSWYVSDTNLEDDGHTILYRWNDGQREVAYEEKTRTYITSSSYAPSSYDEAWHDTETGDYLNTAYRLTNDPSSSDAYNIFGISFTHLDAYSTFTSEGVLDGVSTHVWHTKKIFAAEDGSALTWEQKNDNFVIQYFIEGWNPSLGSFSGSSLQNEATWVWDARAEPTFAPPQLWVNNTLVQWKSGDLLESVGMPHVTDHYESSDGTLKFRIQGDLWPFAQGTGSASISLGGSVANTDPKVFNVSGGWDIQTAAPNRTAPFFIASTPPVLWVEETAYPFAYGYQDAEGGRADVYLVAGGTLTIFGDIEDTTAVVKITHGDVVYNGQVTVGAEDSFDVPGVTISVDGPPPAGFWAGAAFYRRIAGTKNYASFPTSGNTLTLSGTDPAAFTISGTHDGDAVTGTFNSTESGVFLLAKGSTIITACRAKADGSLILGGVAPADFPPAVRTEGLILDFLGLAADDGNTGETAAYYGDTRTAIYCTDSEDANYLTPLSGNPHKMLKIRVGPTSPLTVSLTNYTAATITAGTYDLASHLFQTDHDASNAMPLAYALKSGTYCAWVLGDGFLPPSFIIRGQPWWFAGEVDDVATYRGFYAGQELTLGAPDPTTNLRKIELVDPTHNGGNLASGTLSNDRDSARLSDDTVVLPGNGQGISKPVTPPTDGPGLYTIPSDLDILGNNLSFGILQGDASLAGALLQFSDVSGTGALWSTLSRPNATWIWAHTKDNSTQTTLPAMKLDAYHKLTLFDKPSSPDQEQQAGIVLDPAAGGVSTIRGVLRVRPGGDINMGEFTTTPAGVAAP